MPAFNHETAYARDYQYFPNVKDAQLELRSAAGVLDPPSVDVHVVQADVDGADWAEAGGGALLTDTDAYFWYVWPEVGDGSDDVPQLDDVLVVDDVRYVIRSVGKGQNSARWRISTVEVKYE